MMSISYKLLYFLYFLILLTSLVICLVKIIIDHYEKRRARKIEHLRSTLKAIITGKGGDEKNWTRKKVPISILLSVLETFDVIVESEIWIRIKSMLCDTHLLPWARAHATHFSWSKRNKAVRIFLLSPKSIDLPMMELLLRDRSFFIRMGAVAALAKIASPKVSSLLLAHMAAETPAARFPYRYALLNMPLESLSDLVDIYQNSNDENIRLVCLDIISRRFISNAIKIIKKDYRSPNSSLRLYIVKILGNLASEQAASDLEDFLKDSDPKIRAEAVLSLGKLMLEKSFEKVIEMLHDRDYEVRLQAAIALTKFGKKGIHVLETQDYDIDPQAFHVARYVLTMP